MQQELSPREIIEQLDVEEIDQAIEDLKEELAALQSLRKVAAAKNGKAPARSGNRGNGRMASSQTTERKMSKEERADFALQVVSEFGPMSYRKIAERAGYDPSKAHWMLKAIEKDSRFSVEGETVSLSN